MAEALGICFCPASTNIVLSRTRNSKCRNWSPGADSTGLRSFWLGQWSRRVFPASELPRLQEPNRRRVRAMAGWDELYHNQIRDVLSLVFESEILLVRFLAGRVVYFKLSPNLLLKDCLSHKLVLVSSTVAGLIGQLVKPLTSAASGKGFNMRLIIKPGGMPSTHSAVVTAAATAMGLDRGFSDSLFGFSVIVAVLFMYDAQGVRRSVGKQAEVINTLILTQMSNSAAAPSSSPAPNPSPFAIGVELARDPVQAELKFMEEADSTVPAAKGSKSTAVYNDVKVINGTPSFPVENEEKGHMNGSAVGRSQEFYLAAEKLPSVKEGQVTLQELGDQSGWRHIPLKESVGHTKLEVLVGAIWGVAITIALHSSIQF